MGSWGRRVAFAALLGWVAGCGSRPAHSGFDAGADVAAGDGGAHEAGTVDASDHGADAGTNTDAGGGAPDATTPTGTACGDAIPLAAGETLAHQTTPTSGVASTQCRPSDAPQRFYTFVLPARQRAIVTATPTGAVPWSLVLRVLASCGATECLTDAESDAPGAPVTLVVDSPDDVDLVKTVTVSRLAAGASSEFSLSLQLVPLEPGPASCALPLERPLQLPADTATGALDGSGSIPTTSCETTPGPERIYPLHLDARTSVALRASCDNECVLAVRRACDDPSTDVACDFTSASAGTGGYVRTTLEPGDYFVVLDLRYRPLAGTAGTPYTLSVAAVPPLAPNADCATPTPVTDGTVLRGEDLARGGTPNDACGNDEDSGAIGEPLYYAATVPPGYTLGVTTSPVSLDFGLFLGPGCAQGSCALVPDRHIEKLYRNDGAAPQQVVFYLALPYPLFATDDTTPYRFDLAVRLLPPAPNSTCATATPLAGGARLAGLIPRTGGPSTDCGLEFSYAYRTLFYAVTVPPHTRLDASITPGHNPAFGGIQLIAIDGCGTRACLASATAGEPQPVSVENTGDAPRTVILEVSSAVNRGDLAVDLTPLP